MIRAISFLLVLLSAVPTLAQVRVWEGTFPLPTYLEGPPNVNPPFDLLSPTSFLNYPYTLRDALTAERRVESWRALFLENEYLKCVVLPDVGGHLYNCTDKVNGADLFYANPSLKKASIAYRGAWVAFGVEFNFPVSHNWVSLSPVDFATRTNADGSASVIVGNVDRVYGLQWRVELTLLPGSTVLAQRVTLHNPGDVRHRFYWWNNAAIRIWDDSRIWYPMRHAASHGHTRIEPWPVDAAGRDLSFIRNQTAGAVSMFAYASREPYMGIYHPRTDAGTVHYAEPSELPAKKIWSWGVNADGLDWRRALSDDESAYVEIQAGVFRNQETYGFLEPQETLLFSEYYFPVRGIGGISRANLHAAAHLARERTSSGAVTLRIGVNVTHAVPDATVRLAAAGGPDLLRERVPLHPARVQAYTVALPDPEKRYTFTLADSAGRVLFEHTEDRYDVEPDSRVTLGPQPTYRMPPPARRSEGDFVQAGDALERNGQRLLAYENDRLGLARFSDSFALNKAAGRLAVDLARYEEAVPLLERALARTNNDAETQYYLGLARLALGDRRAARVLFEQAQTPVTYFVAARLQLAQLDAQAGNLESALAHVCSVSAQSPGSVRAGRMEVALLRRLGRLSEARERLAHWRALDPASTPLRIEAVRLGAADATLRGHLAADPERVLEAALGDIELGDYESALALLDVRYPGVSPLTTEPGAVLPQDYPLVAYYRGFCREKLGQAGRADYELASRLSARYVFPSRPSTYAVLRRALDVNPNDATAHYFLGDLYMATGRTGDAVREWQAARQVNAAIPALHRNLGLTLLQIEHAPREALSALVEGIRQDAANVELYDGACRVAAILGAPASDCVGYVRQYPDQRALPASLVQRLALSLVQAGQFAQAESLFHNRFFPRREGGINVREVYLEVQLAAALGLARDRRREEARAAADAIGHPVAALAFTQDGLEPFLSTPRFQYYLGEIESLLGNESAARARWQESLERGRSSQGLDLVFAYLAARRLRDPQEASLRQRLLSSIEPVSEQELAATGNYVHGFILWALGRESEARKVFANALVNPAGGLSWYLAERVLRSLDTPPE
jgi:tetratricopeptide (TPR) repeat protein